MLELVAIGPELPAVAREAIAAWVSGEARLQALRPGAPAAPVFVTLRTSDGNLRGCIGSLVASEVDVVAETARSAVLAASRDPRFMPVTAAELAALSIEVNVLLPDEVVESERDLDPARFGVVVQDGQGRHGLLLPEVPGIDSVKLQIDVARKKAGIDANVPVTLRRFAVLKFCEAGSNGA
jgi:AmmeMemoRadiSam system protein A